MMFNPDLLESLAKREQENHEHDWEQYGHANMRCKKCGLLAKIGFMALKEGKQK